MLGTIPLAVIARMTRSSMLEVLGEDYVRTARAKGLPACRVIGVHALRNALIPVVTVIGLQVGTLMGGAILTETIFSWPGIGKWLVDSIGRRDYPALQGGMLMIASLVMVRQSVVDLLYGVAEPAHPASQMSHGTESTDIPVAVVGSEASAPRRLPPAKSGSRCAPIAAPCSASSSSSRLLLVAILADVIAPHGPIEQFRDNFLHAAGLGGGRQLAVPPRHRRPRPRPAVAHHLWRAALAVHRLDRRHAVAGAGHRARPGLGLLPRPGPTSAIMRLMDIMLSVPSLLLAIVIVAILGPGLINAMIAIAITYVPHYARLTRAAVMTEMSKDYVDGLAGRGRRHLAADVHRRCCRTAWRR